ncbi:hypothetical protein EW145_g1087 [Phellinidium pouzarii]|uniref:ADF-H domain-containing protein n=1 Tax=Phellinidium pouzarii TaxID=167371 RepID=A0A4S4LLB0_9AGAM|nr:hypothetical protein EW145_g1087 [Phellinidium pouzarii]
MSQTVAIPDKLIKQLEEFRFKRNNRKAALVVKILRKELEMVCEKEYDDSFFSQNSLEDLAEELPENAPRYIILSYVMKHEDGRVNFPLVLINWSPTGSPINLLTLHASALHNFQEIANVAKVIEIRDGAEGLTDDAIQSMFK